MGGRASRVQVTEKTGRRERKQISEGEKEKVFDIQINKFGTSISNCRSIGPIPKKNYFGPNLFRINWA